MLVAASVPVFLRIMYPVRGSSGHKIVLWRTDCTILGWTEGFKEAPPSRVVPVVLPQDS